MSGAPARDSRVIVCLHGVGGGSEDFSLWTEALPDWCVETPDLQSGSPELATASMDDYAAVGLAAVPGADAFICGWSMGGLVALMVAARRDVAGLVLIEPSLPAEVAGFHPDVALLGGTFDPAGVFGPRGDGVPARRDSSYAASERRRGVYVGSIRCPVLVIGGASYGETRSRPIAEYLGAQLMEFPDLHHVALLHDPRVLRGVRVWLDSHHASPPNLSVR